MTEYLIATTVLQTIVRGSLEGDERVRFHSPLPLVRSRGVDVNVDDGQCRVTVQLEARLGEHLPALAGEARQKIAAVLGPMTGLSVTEVDVVFSSVFSANG